VWDNNSTHSDPNAATLLAKGAIIMRTPRYCPQLQPLEVFAHVKQNLHRHGEEWLQTMDAVTCIVLAFHLVTPDLLKECVRHCGFRV
jgi:hypothetical protein